MLLDLRGGIGQVKVIDACLSNRGLVRQVLKQGKIVIYVGHHPTVIRPIFIVRAAVKPAFTFVTEEGWFFWVRS